MYGTAHCSTVGGFYRCSVVVVIAAAVDGTPIGVHDSRFCPRHGRIPRRMMMMVGRMISAAARGRVGIDQAAVAAATTTGARTNSLFLRIPEQVFFRRGIPLSLWSCCGIVTTTKVLHILLLTTAARGHITVFGQQ